MKRQKFILATFLSLPTLAFARFENLKLSKRKVR